MVGPRGVGKTSLLAAMYAELKNELLDIGCSFLMERGPTQVAINTRLRELKQVAFATGAKIQIGEGISASSQEETFTFHLEVGDGGEAEASLQFTDLPGGWYTGTGNFEKADQILAESAVSFLAVDATALMESPSKMYDGLGKYHQEINAPDFIQDAYERVTFTNPHSVVLTLIRAETYIDKGRVDELILKTRQAYTSLAKMLACKGISLCGCYVETVGSLYFNAFTKSDGVISTEFIRDPNKGYKPTRCAVPLRIAVHGAFQSAKDQASEDVERNDILIYNILTDLLGFNTPLKQAREKESLVVQVFDSIAQKTRGDDYFDLL